LRELKLDNVELETGRPRTEAYIVYLFLMLRGFNGGCTVTSRSCALGVRVCVLIDRWTVTLQGNVIGITGTVEVPREAGD
jgi:hypothetical protein